MTVFARNLYALSIALGLTASGALAQDLTSSVSGGDQCFNATLDRYIWVRSGSVANTASGPARYAQAQDLFEKNKAQGFRLMMNGPWDVSLIPTFEAQAEAVTDSLISADTTGLLLSGIYLDESHHLIALEGAEKFLTANQPTKLNGLINQVLEAFGQKKESIGESSPSQPTEPAIAATLKDTATLMAACAQMSVLNSVSCVNASTALLNEVSYDRNFILPKLWKEFTSTPKLRDGIRLGALRLIARMKSKKPGYLFEDLQLGFERAGFSRVEAVDATWKALALYGNSGANVGYRLSLLI